MRNRRLQPGRQADHQRKPQRTQQALEQPGKKKPKSDFVAILCTHKTCLQFESLTDRQLVRIRTPLPLLPIENRVRRVARSRFGPGHFVDAPDFLFLMDDRKATLFIRASE